MPHSMSCVVGVGFCSLAIANSASTSKSEDGDVVLGSFSQTCALRLGSREEDTRKRTKGCDFTTRFATHDPLAVWNRVPCPLLWGAELQLDQAGLAGCSLESQFHPQRIYIVPPQESLRGKKHPVCFVSRLESAGVTNGSAGWPPLATITLAALINLFAVPRRSNESVSRQRA